MKRGLEAGILQTIKNLMDTLKMTAKQAMAALKISADGCKIASLNTAIMKHR